MAANRQNPSRDTRSTQRSSRNTPGRDEGRSDNRDQNRASSRTPMAGSPFTDPANSPGQNLTPDSGILDFRDERDYWREQYASRPYYSEQITFEEYEPAYRYGYESYRNHPDHNWDDSMDDLESGWEKFKDKSSLTWEKAKHAIKDAWDRMAGRESGPGHSHDSRSRR